MIDIPNEKMLLLSKVPQWCEKHLGQKMNRSTVFRWKTRGSRGRRLETILVGVRRYTSEEALARFFNASTKAQDGEGSTHSRITAKAHDDSEAYLKSEGM